MARSPLILDSPMGQLFLLELAPGVSALMIQQDGLSLSYPLDPDQASSIVAWLRGINPNLKGRPQTIDYQEVADAYNEAKEQGVPNVREYMSRKLGITISTVNYRIGKARSAGLL